MLLIMPKAEVPVDTIRDLKRAATLWIKKREPSLRHFRWQRGYGAFSVGQGETGAIQKYINGQEERHRNESFKEEFVKFLKKYGFPYDESKMWM
jgi:REP element-mobilizing transposase RayT